MENINEIFKLCDELGITTIGQLKAIRQPNKNVLDCLKEIQHKRQDYLKDYFKCEICGFLTPYQYEGAEPNTCEECMPRVYWEISAKNQRNNHE